jgi:hypothetical protein
MPNLLILHPNISVIPAKAGIYFNITNLKSQWIPASAGVTAAVAAFLDLTRGIKSVTFKP